MTRQHHVNGDLDRTVARRRRRSGGPSCIEVENNLLEALPLIWEKHSPWYGALSGAWTGGLKPPERRLALLVQNLAAGLLARLNPVWEIDLDIDEHHRPTALILTHGDTTEVVNVTMSGSLLKIGGDPVGLASNRAGARILGILARTCGAFYGAPVRLGARDLV